MFILHTTYSESSPYNLFYVYQFCMLLTKNESVKTMILDSITYPQIQHTLKLRHFHTNDRHYPNVDTEAILLTTDAVLVENRNNFSFLDSINFLENGQLIPFPIV